MTAKPLMSGSPEKRRDFIAQLPLKGTSLEAADVNEEDVDSRCEITSWGPDDGFGPPAGQLLLSAAPMPSFTIPERSKNSRHICF
jgi:hypothetical protein